MTQNAVILWNKNIWELPWDVKLLNLLNVAQKFNTQSTLHLLIFVILLLVLHYMTPLLFLQMLINHSCETRQKRALCIQFCA